MLQVGGGELLVIVIAALVLVGPEQLPSVMRKMGSWAGEARSIVNGLRSEFMAGLDELELTDKPSRGAGTGDDPIVPRGTADKGADATLAAAPADESLDPVTAAEVEARAAAAGAAAAAANGSGPRRNAVADANAVFPTFPTADPANRTPRPKATEDTATEAEDDSQEDPSTEDAGGDGSAADDAPPMEGVAEPDATTATAEDRPVIPVPPPGDPRRAPSTRVNELAEPRQQRPRRASTRPADGDPDTDPTSGDPTVGTPTDEDQVGGDRDDERLGTPAEEAS